MKQFAQKKGADLVNIFKYTGFKTPVQYFSETSQLERVFLAEAVKQFEKENQKRSSKILNAIFGK